MPSRQGPSEAANRARFHGPTRTRNRPPGASTHRRCIGVIGSATSNAKTPPREHPPPTAARGRAQRRDTQAALPPGCAPKSRLDFRPAAPPSPAQCGCSRLREEKRLGGSTRDPGPALPTPPRGAGNSGSPADQWVGATSDYKCRKD